MFIIKYKDKVISGPFIWDKIQFQKTIYGKFKINAALPFANINEKKIVVNDDISIWPVDFTENPSYNQRTQYLDGPFYTYDEEAGRATHYMEVVDYSFEQAQVFAKDYYTQTRWLKQNLPFDVTIGSDTYRLNINNRSSFESGIAGNWKLDKLVDVVDDENVYRQSWVTLSEEGLQTINNAFKQHVQNCFDWEKSKHDNVDSLTTFDELNALEEETL
jgi:hypothetical protein